MRDTIAKLFWAGVIGVALGFGAPAKPAEPSTLIDLGLSPDGNTHLYIAGATIKLVSEWPNPRILSAQVGLMAVDGSSFILTENYFNCENNTFAIMAAQEFTGSVESSLSKSDTPDWKPAERDTVIYVILKRVCGVGT